MLPAKRGGAFAGTKTNLLVADATTNVEKGDVLAGDAHKIFDHYTQAVTKKGGKVAKDTITKKVLKDMVCDLQKAQRIQFISLGMLEAFVDKAAKADDETALSLIETVGGEET